MSEFSETPPWEDGPDEAKVTSRKNWLRAGVLGANDGIVSMAALVIGVAAAADRPAILVAGLAGLAAGALSMAVGEFVSVSSQRDAEVAQLERERKWHADRPDWELEQLAELHMATGMDKKTATAAARQQTAHDPLAAHARAHLGIDPEELVSPIQAGLASMIAFTLGGIAPLVTILYTSASVRVPLTFVAVLLALAFTGWASARLGHAGKARAIVRNIVGGSLAMSITYGIGTVVGLHV
jgi:VIT1/CCC1 family predicted Fe2+/Mn2+ transporter